MVLKVLAEELKKSRQNPKWNCPACMFGERRGTPGRGRSLGNLRLSALGGCSHSVSLGVKERKNKMLLFRVGSSQ